MNPIELRRKAHEVRQEAQAILSALKSEESASLTAEEIDAKVAEATDLNEQAKALVARAEQVEALERDIVDGSSDFDETPVGIMNAPTSARAQVDDPEAATGGGVTRHSIPATARDREREARCDFQDFGDFAMSVYAANPASGARHFIDPRLQALYNGNLGEGLADPRQAGRSARAAGRPLAAASGLNTGVGADGGWLLPPAFAMQIWDGMRNEVDNLLGMTDQWPITSDSIEIPANAETSRATGSRYGGVRGYWIAEADQIPSSNPKLRRVKLEPHELAVLCYVTDRLLNNAGSVVSTWLTRAATQELIWLIGDAIINGDGAGKPLGILNSSGRVTVAKVASQAADTFTQTNVAAMWARMHARSRMNARWFVNQDVDPELLTMFFEVRNAADSDNVGGFSARLYNAETDTLMGRPVIRTEWNQTLGDEGDVILADMMAYATAFFDSGMQQAMSMHLRFDYLETAFRFVTSVDGQTYNESPLTPANGSNTLSPFVTLAARA